MRTVWKHLICVWICALIQAGVPAAAIPADSSPDYVGSAACLDCHQDAARDWTGSHHQLAMLPADAASVLAPFNNESATYEDSTLVFSRSSDAGSVEGFFVDVRQAEDTTRYQVTHTFGVYPLQQYLVIFPQGRLQVLPLAWDSRPAEAGGQRWFAPLGHMAPQDRPVWTSWQYNWNTMCAECHSTQLEKRYDFASDTFDTTWSDVSVGCEACHGPGSIHVAQQAAEEPPERLWIFNVLIRSEGGWQPDKKTGKPVRYGKAPVTTQIETCGVCHARRSQLFEDDRTGQSLLTSFTPALLESALYEDNGVILDEVYVYGSFLQSRMYEAGVTCTDCHNPHSLEFREAPQGNVCLNCHGANYNTETHYVTDPSLAEQSCVGCHMPARTYMGVDLRHDHSFRVPDETGGEPSRFDHYTRAITASRMRQADGDAQLLAYLSRTNTPGIYRATAVSEYLSDLTQAKLPQAAAFAQDAEPLVRMAVLQQLSGLPVQLRWQLLSPLLNDSEKTLRALAAGQLADVPEEQLGVEQSAALLRARALHRDALWFNSDTPVGRTNLGNNFRAEGDYQQAEALFRSAIEQEPGWVAAYLNLADLYRELKRDEEGRQLLEEALDRLPDAAALHHSLGLLLIRQQEQVPAMYHLKRSVELSPGNSRHVYVYAVALNSAGQVDAARSLLTDALAQDPGQLSLQTLLMQLSR